MILRRPAAERGHTDLGWLDSRHTFSFGHYRDPSHMGFRALRVINDDRIAPGRGFGEHPHADMEILTWVVDGALEHRDSLGNGSTVRPGELQRMTAGRGIAHSEFNASETDELRLLQIWIEPARHGLEPGYEQRSFALDESRGAFRVLASPDGRDDSLTIHQDATLAVARLDAGDVAEASIAPGRHAWVQVVRGEVEIDGVSFATGDGGAVSDAPRVRCVGVAPDSEVLLFDLA